MASLSVFCDEAGQQDMSAGYYLLTLVLHDQSTSLGPFVDDYESHVVQNGLPDIAFHMKDLLHGHGDYEGIDQSVRKKLLIHFNIFMQKAPVRYRTFVYGSYDTDAKTLSAKMRRDIVNFVYNNLEWFQSFDKVPIYYDEGADSRNPRASRGVRLPAGEWRSRLSPHRLSGPQAGAGGRLLLLHRAGGHQVRARRGV